MPAPSPSPSPVPCPVPVPPPAPGPRLSVSSGRRRLRGDPGNAGAIARVGGDRHDRRDDRRQRLGLDRRRFGAPDDRRRLDARRRPPDGHRTAQRLHALALGRRRRRGLDVSAASAAAARVRARRETPAASRLRSAGVTAAGLAIPIVVISTSAGEHRGVQRPGERERQSRLAANAGDRAEQASGASPASERTAKTASAGAKNRPATG